MERTIGQLERRGNRKAKAVPPDPECMARPAVLSDAERRRHARIQSGSLAVIAVGGVLTMMYLAKTVLILTLVSVLIAFMLAPIVELCRRIRLPRSIGALIAVLLMCAALYGIFYVSYSQADEFMSELPKYSGQIRSVLSQVGCAPSASARLPGTCCRRRRSKKARSPFASPAVGWTT